MDADAHMLEWLDSLGTWERAVALGKHVEWEKLSNAEKLRIIRFEHAAEMTGDTDDAANLCTACYSVDFAEIVDCEADNWQEEFDLVRDEAEAFAKLEADWRAADYERHTQDIVRSIAEIASAPANMRVQCVALAFALGHAPVFLKIREGTPGNYAYRDIVCNTQSEAALALNTSRQNLNKEVQRHCRRYHIEHGVHLKSPEARASFSAAQAANHWRHRSYAL
jgi:hypothetical protein